MTQRSPRAAAAALLLALGLLTFFSSAEADQPYVYAPYSGSFTPFANPPALALSLTRPPAKLWPDGPAPGRAVTTPRPAPRQSSPAPSPVRHRTAPPTHTSYRSLSGFATWYCWPAYPSPCTHGHYSGYYGAAGPELRAWLGNWRGKTVIVCGRRCIRVTLIDWCKCTGSAHRLIDLYHDAYVVTGGTITIHR